jgi:hypothetical protein
MKLENQAKTNGNIKESKENFHDFASLIKVAKVDKHGV